MPQPLLHQRFEPHGSFTCSFRGESAITSDRVESHAAELSEKTVAEAEGATGLRVGAVGGDVAGGV